MSHVTGPVPLKLLWKKHFHPVLVSETSRFESAFKPTQLCGGIIISPPRGCAFDVVAFVRLKIFDFLSGCQ